VPQVAFDAQVYSINRPLPKARPAPAPDQTPATPFASLLDDSTQSAPDSPPPPASDARADAPGQAATPARDADSKAPEKAAKTDAQSANEKPADPVSADETLACGGLKTVKTVTISKATCSDPAVADDKPVEETASADEPNPLSDAIAADIQAPAIAAAAPPSTPIPTLRSADETALASQAVSVTGSPAAVVAAPKTSSSLRAASQTSDGKPAAPSKLAAKAASQPPTEEEEPQAAAIDADKEAPAKAAVQTRGEPAGPNHRAAAVEAPVAQSAETNAAAPNAGTDAMQPAALTAPAQTTPAATPASPAATQLAPQAAAVPLAGVAIEIASHAEAGKNHFEIRLDPPELGRIEVRLDVDGDGNVTTRMIADRADTLNLLRRDAAGLERALQDAGLKTADNSLQFSLRDHSSHQQQDNNGVHTARLIAQDTTLPPIEAAQRGYSRLAGQGSGIDIHV